MKAACAMGMKSRMTALHMCLGAVFLTALPVTALAEVVYEEIHDFQVRSFSLRMAHPYEIRIPNTDFGQLIVCRIFDRDGNVLPDQRPSPTGPRENSNQTGFSTQMDNTGNGETRLYFSHKVAGATFRCFYARVERE